MPPKRKLTRTLPEFRGLPEVLLKPRSIGSDPWILYYPKNQHTPLVIYLYHDFKGEGPKVYISTNTRVWNLEQLDVISRIYTACAVWLENQMETEP
jgi:hypothetical protein